MCNEIDNNIKAHLTIQNTNKKAKIRKVKLQKKNNNGRENNGSLTKLIIKLHKIIE